MNRAIAPPTQSTIAGARSAARSKERPNTSADSATTPGTRTVATTTTGTPTRSSNPLGGNTAELSLGDEYVVEFLGHRFAFNAVDFEERVTAAAVTLGLVCDNDLDVE